MKLIYKHGGNSKSIIFIVLLKSWVTFALVIGKSRVNIFNYITFFNQLNGKGSAITVGVLQAIDWA